MSGLPSYDDDLLARLNALKKSNIQLDPSKPRPLTDTAKKETPESDLSARLRSLRNGSASPSPAPKPTTAIRSNSEASAFPSTPLDEPESDPLRHPTDIDDKTLDELLADLGPEDQWTLNPDDPADIQKLLNEAKNALPSEKAEPSSKDDEEAGEASRPGDKKPDKEYLIRDLDMSAFALDDGEPQAKDTKHGSKLEDESREAQDIVARLLDEVNLEKAAEREDQGNSPGAPTEKDEEESTLSLPSAPTKLPDLSVDPETSKNSLDFESDITARMAALRGLGATDSLGLPSAPTFKPSDKPVNGVMKKYTDEEVDTWCIICQDDATVKCIGCGGDLYCANCWKEGHMGPDVGYEEKMHKWTKYKKMN
ncbi:uncharacterized protein LY89DRAFT_18405 [Mollisia scopiformis]|uniref:Abscission/NoCut checkpoint regulator n=1 Tax=Mollisia scopiformis TaxID=149040 RepID=A0A194XX21_MOLSC|nr:uncharacterized protein LY89DRAFT_18405 [Mollisia scopiformis]KUJ24327.1 hypothetical protein LY89DRAFT_18405 [Mollisia scopiformis]